MALKESFASVLKALRGKRNISQYQFGDAASRTYLSKLEAGRSSITIDKLDQLSQKLELSPLTLLTLTLSESTGRQAADLITQLRSEIDELARDGGFLSLRPASDAMSKASAPLLRGKAAKMNQASSPAQSELLFADL